MTLFFNILVLEQETSCDPDYMLQALRFHWQKRTIAKHKHSVYKPIKKSLAGSSFLLNPESFFTDKTTDIRYLAQYLRLAARRDYSLYKSHRLKYLDLTYFTDLNLSALDSNPLLEITNKQIKFKYEELTNGNNQL
jgi:hypothetical protein